MPITTWVVYPERSDSAPVVLVIHEIFGLTDWVRGVADQFAAEGFIAVAPDLLSGMGPDGGGTDSIGSQDDVVATIRTLEPDERTRRLDAARTYALDIPAGNGRIGSVGFCWGGSSSFAYAVSQPQLDAAVVYYGTSPAEAADYERINAPILGLYGGTTSGSTRQSQRRKKRWLVSRRRSSRTCMTEPATGSCVPKTIGTAPTCARPSKRGRARSSSSASTWGTSGSSRSAYLNDAPMLSTICVILGEPGSSAVCSSGLIA